MATVDIVDIAGLVKGASKGRIRKSVSLEILESVMRLYTYYVVLITIILFTLMVM
jgi:hypothetical protein